MWDQIKLALTPKTKLELPIQLIVFVTDRCNARCAHCFNWRALNLGHEGLALETLRQLSDELGKLLTLGISGGEPFLRPDITSVCNLFIEKNKVHDIAIPTNGLMPAHIATQVQGILERNETACITISISLDGLPELHDCIRGVRGSFIKAYETYQAVAAIKQALPGNLLNIKVATTLCNWNIRQIPALIDWVQDKMSEINFHNFEIMRGEPRRKDIGPPSVAELEWVKPYIFRAWKKYAFYGKDRQIQSWIALGLKRYIFNLYIEILRQKRQLIPCYAARTSAVVDASGNLYFCELREAIGNVHESTISELWHSERAESVRASIEQGECYCVHSCFQQKNVFLNPRLWPYVALYLFTGKFVLPYHPIREVTCGSSV